MSIALHIDPFSSSMGDVRVAAPEFSPECLGASLLTRIWLWLSQLWGHECFSVAAEAVFCLGVGEPLNTAPPYCPNRHDRRMIARRARGICPASRYAYYGMGGPLRAGLSLAARYEWVKNRCRRTWFQTRHWKYYVRAYFSRLALWIARKIIPALAWRGALCHAPLSLE